MSHIHGSCPNSKFSFPMHSIINVWSAVVYFIHINAYFLHYTANDTFLLVSGSQTVEFLNPRDQSVKVVFDTLLNLVPGNIVASDYDSL